MKQLFSTIKSSAIGLTLGGVLVFWGIYDEGVIITLLGLVIFYISIRVSINDQKLHNEIQKWKDDNRGKLVFFYPVAKLLQDKIRETIFPLMPSGTFQVYYDGPKLAGNIDSRTIKQLMFEFKQISVNSPCLFKIDGSIIHYESLEELKLMHKRQVDFNLIQSKINKIISA